MAAQVEIVNIKGPSLPNEGAKITPLHKVVSKEEQETALPKMPRRARGAHTTVASPKIVPAQDVNAIASKIVQQINQKGVNNFLKDMLGGNMALIVAQVSKSNTESFSELETSGASSLQALDAALQNQNSQMVDAYNSSTTSQGGSIGASTILGIVVAVVVAVVVIAAVTYFTGGLGDVGLMSLFSCGADDVAPDMAVLEEAGGEGADEGAAAADNTAQASRGQQILQKGQEILSKLSNLYWKTGLFSGALAGAGTGMGVYYGAGDGNPMWDVFTQETPNQHKLNEQQKRVQQSTNMSQILNQKVSETTTLDITDGTQEQVQAQNIIQTMLTIISQLYTIKH